MGQLLSVAMGLAGLVWWLTLLRDKPLELELTKTSENSRSGKSPRGGQ
jgi:hypothetical protein